MKRPGRPVIIASVVAVLLGSLLGGMTLDYTTFFVTTEGLQDILAVPAIIIGLIAGWWCWLPTLLFMAVTSIILLARALIGRDLDQGYLWFAFALTVGSIWEFWFQTFLASYIGAFFRMLGIRTFRLIRPKNEEEDQGEIGKWDMSSS
jgi:hypothetical protein